MKLCELCLTFAGVSACVFVIVCVVFVLVWYQSSELFCLRLSSLRGQGSGSAIRVCVKRPVWLKRPQERLRGASPSGLRGAQQNRSSSQSGGNASVRRTFPVVTRILSTGDSSSS